MGVRGLGGDGLGRGRVMGEERCSWMYSGQLVDGAGLVYWGLDGRRI
jgi:hypothetical protein